MLAVRRAAYEHPRRASGLAPHLESRKGVNKQIFMLATDYPLLDFVRKLTALNHGRIYETDPNNIGAYVFRDFVRNRRKRLH